MKNMTVAYILGLITLTANVSYSAMSCPAISIKYPPSVEAMNDGDLFKQYQINFAKNSMALFCDRNMLLRYLRSNKLVTTNECTTLTSDQLAPLVSSIPGKKSPWEMSITPSLRTKQMAADYYSFSDNLEPLDLYSLEAQANLPAYFSKINKKLDALEINNLAKDVAVSTKIKMFCKGENLLPSSTCAQQLTLVKNKMAPKGVHTDATDIQLWKRVIGSEKYDLGLIKAVKILKSKKMPDDSSDVFSDILKGFLQSGLNQKEANDATWDILGIMSNHGPNIANYLSSIENSEYLNVKTGYAPQTQKSRLIAYIAAVLPLYDRLNLLNGKRMYSYPKNVYTSCDNYKPYHFWMAAYLARSLVVHDHFSPDDAAAASYLAEKGYQIYRNIASDGRQGHAVLSVLNYNPYDPVHQVIRMDLAYAAAGSIFGANSTVESKKSNVVDVNKAIVSLLSESSALEADEVNTSNYKIGFVSTMFDSFFGSDPEIVKRYVKWRMIFRADVAFTAIKN